jgi:tetratricopeptide (TPR) repeat protein
MLLLRIALVAGLLALPALPAVLPAAQQARWEELNARVQDLYALGKYAEATSVAQEALRVAEATFGPEHPDVATSLNNLAMLYQDQGKYAEAESLYQRALRIWEKARLHPLQAHTGARIRPVSPHPPRGGGGGV